MSGTPLPCDNSSVLNIDGCDDGDSNPIGEFIRLPLSAVAELRERTQTLAAVVRIAGNLKGECFARRQRIAADAVLPVGTVSNHLRRLTPTHLCRFGRQGRRTQTYRLTDETHRIWGTDEFAMLPTEDINVKMPWCERIVYAVIVSEAVMRDSSNILMEPRLIAKRSNVTTRHVHRLIPELVSRKLVSATPTDNGYLIVVCRLLDVSDKLDIVSDKLDIGPRTNWTSGTDKSDIAMREKTRKRISEREPLKKNAASAAMRGLKDSDFQKTENVFQWLDRFQAMEPLSEARQRDFVSLWMYVKRRANPNRTRKNRLTHPAGAFVSFLTRAEWNRITGPDEDAATRVIRDVRRAKETEPICSDWEWPLTVQTSNADVHSTIESQLEQLRDHFPTLDNS